MSLESNLSLDTSLDAADVVIVGAGFYGLTMARLCADDGFNVTVIESRGHIGGNAWSEIDPETGIEVHKYGTHIFHTSNEKVWNFVNRFSEFNSYQHYVMSLHDNRTYTLPVNLGTLDKFFGQALSPTSAKDLIESKKSSVEAPDNFEDHALSLMGPELYDAFFKNYTHKQWQVDPRKLPKSILTRLPFRFNFNTRYFNDKYEGLPSRGYFGLLSNLASHTKIDIHLQKDFFDERSKILGLDKPVVYTGPLDRYFDYSEGVLGWRTLDFEFEVHDMEDFQGCAVMNYADLEPAYTRIHEFKHLHPERASTSKTIIAKEFSRIATSDDSPYYPINSVEDRDSLARYRALSELENGVLFGGRLGSYMYLDMHMAIAAAMSDFENKLRGQLI